MEKIRCFIAIELSDEIRRVLSKAEDELKGYIDGVTWVKPDNIHLTLKFLGRVEPDIVESVKEVIEKAAKATGPFKVSLAPLGAFPSVTYPRVIWVGIGEGVKETKVLADIFEDELPRLGIEKENRPFHPHLTLGRVKFIKDKSAFKNAFSAVNIPQAEMTVSKIALFQSALSREGSIYTSLGDVSLINNTFRLK